MSEDKDAFHCDECGLVLDPDKGEVFLADDGIFCNDHYPRNMEA